MEKTNARWQAAKRKAQIAKMAPSRRRGSKKS